MSQDPLQVEADDLWEVLTLNFNLKGGVKGRLYPEEGDMCFEPTTSKLLMRL